MLFIPFPRWLPSDQVIFMGLTDGKVASMSDFKAEQIAKLAEAASQLNPNKLKGSDVMAGLKACGLSQLDASLVTDCVNVQKACLWQNTDDVTPEQAAAAQEFLLKNHLGINVEVTNARFGKYIWETTLVR